jgi:hypothetical protein
MEGQKPSVLLYLFERHDRASSRNSLKRHTERAVPLALKLATVVPALRYVGRDAAFANVGAISIGFEGVLESNGMLFFPFPA